MNYSSIWGLLRGPMVYRSPDEDAGGGEADAGGAEGGADEDAGGGDGGTGGDEPPEGEGDGGEGGSEDAGGEAEAAAGDDDTKPKRVPWQTKRIDTLTARLSAKDEEIARVKRENDALKALAGGDPDAGGDKPKTYTEDEVEQRAQAIASARTLNAKIETVYDQALEADPKFAQNVENFRSAVADQLRTRPDFFEALVDLPNAAAVLNELARDPDKAVELVDMSPAKMGMEMARMSNKLAAPAPPRRVSAAPPPPKTVDGGSTKELALDDPKLPMAEFEKRRQAEREARQGR